MIRGGRRLLAAAAAAARNHPGAFADRRCPLQNAGGSRNLSSLLPGSSSAAREVRPYPFNLMSSFRSSSTSSPAAENEKKESTEERTTSEVDKKEQEEKVIDEEKLAQLYGVDLFKGKAEPEVKVDEESLSPEAARDLADAKEFTERYEDMLKLNSKLKQSIGTLGLVQLLSGWWIVATDFSAETLYFFYTGLSATLSLQIALLLHRTMKPLPKRGDKKILSAPLSAIKSVNSFLGRTNLASMIAVTGMIGALGFEVVPSLNSYLS